MAVKTPPKRNKEAFRDRISTVGDDGRRKWLYVKKQTGKYYNARTVVSTLLLGFLFGAPFVKIGGNPLILFDILNRKFIFFGVIFWPQDFIIFGIIFLTSIVFIVLFTVAFGRVFCGWICPQTIFMEMVFRRIEYMIEGDYNKQKKLARQPWNSEKIIKKTLKHTIFFAISFLIANVFLSYIIGIEVLQEIVTDHPKNHLVGLSAIIAFSLAFYGVFSKFREQACTMVCPYGRLQGVLLDSDSVVVAYDYVRGEPRGKLRKGQERTSGDCIDCKQCVFVCPTGIDIRNGTQLECVNCTACIDACDEMMERIDKPKGLIRYDSENGIKNGQKFRITPRIGAYIAVLTILVGAIGALLFMRQELDTTLIRSRGQIYQKTDRGTFTNLYNYKVINKSATDKAVTLRLISPKEATIQIIGQENNESMLQIPVEGLVTGAVIIEMSQETARKAKRKIEIGFYDQDGRLIETEESKFMVP